MVLIKLYLTKRMKSSFRLGMRPRLKVQTLQKAIENHGGIIDLKILQREFPDASNQILKERLADSACKLSNKTPFTIQEDIEIVSKVLSRGQKSSETWAALATRLGRTFHTTRYRFYNHIKLNALNRNSKGGGAGHQSPLLETRKEEPFEVLLRKERIRLAAILSGDAESISSYSSSSVDTIKKTQRANKIWTAAMDAHLLAVLKQIGPSFSLMTKDFPQFSAYELRNRHNKLSSKVFLPHEDLIIVKELMNGNRIVADGVLKLLPHHSINYVWRRKRMLEKGNLVLNRNHIEIISRKIEQHGRGYFYLASNEFLKFASAAPEQSTTDAYLKEKVPIELGVRLSGISGGWTRSKLKQEWAKHEPPTQVNPVWPLERDLELLRSWIPAKRRLQKSSTRLDWSTFGIKELETRWEVLQRSPLKHHRVIRDSQR